MDKPASHVFDQLQEAQPPMHHRWLQRYLWVMTAVTFGLIILGGTVTSKDAGLAVPDWPHTFGYNMLTYPPSLWQGGVFWEHTHRLLATLVGLLGLILLGWVMIAPRLLTSLRVLGGVIFVLVCIQGLMGGLRVTEVSTALGVVHGVTGQLFFALMVVTCVIAGKPWLERRLAQIRTQENTSSTPNDRAADKSSVKTAGEGFSSFSLACMFLAVLVVQLALGASMRHYKAGLAIPDFPTAYGQLVPPLTTKGIEHAMDTHAGGPQDLEGYYSPMKVSVHFAHRLWAVTVLVAAFGLVSIMGSRQQLDHPVLFRLSMAIVALLLVQVMLGAFVIWSGRHPEVATAHQTTGALILGLATFLMMQLKIITQPACPACIRGEAGDLEPQQTGAPGDGPDKLVATECVS